MTWAAFEQYALDRYKVYMYLATAQGLGTSVFETLGRTGLFRGEGYLQDAFITDVVALLVSDGWEGEIEVGENWSGFYTKGDFQAFITKIPYLMIVLNHAWARGNIVYEWQQGYQITRNGIEITRDQLLEMVAVDLKV